MSRSASVPTSATNRVSLLVPQRGQTCEMDELREKLARLREDAMECDRMSEQALDPDHRDMLGHLAASLRQMIEDVEEAIARIAGEERYARSRACLGTICYRCVRAGHMKAGFQARRFTPAGCITWPSNSISLIIVTFPVTRLTSM